MQDNLLEFYKETAERERYTHGILWRGIQFFVVLISGLITVGVSLATTSLYATLVTFILAIILTFLGRYVLIKESGYFHEERWKRMKLQEKLGYYEIEEMKQTTEACKKDMWKSRQDYVEENVNSKSGVRYAFRLIYLIQAMLCWFTYILLFGRDFSSFELAAKVFNVSTIIIMGMAIIVWYRSEFKTLLDIVN
jgi:Flp pilus assembly protein TadB